MGSNLQQKRELFGRKRCRKKGVQKRTCKKKCGNEAQFNQDAVPAI
jgi:hypothetical protein